jgi:hypothetical protein
LRCINGKSRTIAIVACGELFWLLLIGVVHARDATTKNVVSALALLVLGIAIRAGFSFDLVLGHDAVTTRTLVRTRSWRYGELRSAELVEKPLRNSKRTLVMLNPVIGRPYRFTTLEEAPEPLSDFDAVIQETNIRIFEARLNASYRRW